MGAATEEGYIPPPEFEEDSKDPLLDLNLTDSTELWLIQWPANQPSDFDGQELTLNLTNDGQLGSFEGSSGKTYDVVSFASQEPDATVFQCSASESKVVGKISRRVSLVHYPEPKELEKLSSNNLKEIYQRSSGTSLTHSSRHFSTPTRSSKMTKSSLSASKHSASTHGSRHKGSLSQAGESSKPSKKRKQVHESSGSMGHSAQDSGRDHSAVTSSGSRQQSRGNSTLTSSGSLDHSHGGKSKKKTKNEE